MIAETISSILNPLSGLLTIIISIIVTYIAYQQHRVEKDEVRLALYEKRFLVYQSVVAFLNIILINANVKNDELNQFYTKTAESNFLFGNEVSDYLTDMKKKAIRIMWLNERLKTAPISDERNKLVKEDSELVEWFNNQFEETTKLFRKYLSLENY